MDFEKGEVLLIDKPLGWTSFQALKKLRYQLKIKKIGHAGTLDPLATGLLILCTGKKTKEIDSYQAQEKEYTGTFVLGKTTPSIDLETDFDAEYDITHLNIENISSVIPQFIGEIDQTPPIFSAIKQDGKRLYELARKGQETDIKSRKILITELEFTDTSRFPEVDFRVVCSKGTYIRSLARDIGIALGAGAYLKALCRTRIGEFKLEDAWQIQDLIEQVKNS
ncbi:MAG: tRNA pseudouridine(55) synthase TruB [Raineya sp.]|jgi:tRNA pseudouridine55 synthase|nr:tRNA pseudouridine(55) synthase TruB [Raineya sp.]